MSKIPLRPPLADEVVAKLQDAVAQRRWKVGDRIPSEPELIAEMGVSRGTMREAIRALARTGVFEVRRGDGMYVRATSEISATTQRVYRKHAEQDVLQVRFALDAQSALLTAKAADAQVVRRLRTLLRQRVEEKKASVAMSYRPSYHFSVPDNWKNDPQRPVYLDGEDLYYFLYNEDYILRGSGTRWRLATTTDHVNFTDHGVAISKHESPNGDCWSGSIVIDEKNTAG